MNVQQPAVLKETLPTQFQNLGLNSEMGQQIAEANITPVAFIRGGSCRSSGSRSISDAGLHRPNIPFHPGVRPQTAPTNSDNCYGFSYPYMIFPYDNSPNSSNNNLYQHAIVDNPRFGIPVSSAPSSLRPNSPAADNGNFPVTTLAQNGGMLPLQSPFVPSRDYINPVMGSGVNSVVPPPRSTAAYQGMLQIPHVPGYFLVPQVSPPLHNSGTTTPRTTPSPNLQPSLTVLSESPETETADRPKAQAMSPSSSVAVENQLKINVESNDNTLHDWFPPHTGTVNYPFLPHVFHISPGNESSNFSHSASSALEHVVPTNVQFPPPVYWNQPSLPVLSMAPFDYSQSPYYQLSPLNNSMYSHHQVEMYVHQQQATLNKLRYDLLRTKLDIANCKDEIKDLEQQLKDKSALPNKDQITQLRKEIAQLGTECQSLVLEVDKYSHEKALLGQINDGDFYGSINTGQQGPLTCNFDQQGPLTRKDLPKKEKGSKKPPPPRPPLPSQDRLSKEEDEENSDSNRWCCKECTFLNHPRISEYCELCNQPRNSAGQSIDD